MGCMEGRKESLRPARESKAARASGKRILWRRNLQWCGIQPKELEAAASDKSHWRSLTQTASTNFGDERLFKDSCSLWTTPQSILCWHHNNGVRVPHPFQTLLFQTGFAEPPENPWMITQHALFFGHERQPPIANFWALRLRLSKRHVKNHGVALNLEILVDNSIPESVQALKTFPLLILTWWKASVCLPFTKSFCKIWLESKWNTTFWVVPAGGISGSNRTSEKVVCFSGWNVQNGNSSSISLKPSLISVSGFRGRFSANAIELCK